MRLIHKMMIGILAVALLSGFFGCSSDPEPDSFPDITSYRDIPGVTEEEIRAVESLRERYDSFVYAMPPSTEAFVDVNGNIEGFSALFCEWLTGLFGIQFIPENRLFGDVLAGLQAGEIDFTGTMTPTEERKAIYHMTDPIAIRTLKYFRLRGSIPLSEIQTTRPARFALLEGSSVAAMVISSLNPDTFEVVPVESNVVVYEMLKNGEIDAFIHERPTESIFDGYNDVITQDFLPAVMSQVSLTAQKPELEPVISIIQKFLDNEGMRYLIELYNLGEIEYRRHKLYLYLTEEELDYIRSDPVIRFVAEHDNYPVSFYNTHDREFQGISHDILSEIETLTGLRFELLNDRNADWAEILLMLENGEASMVTELIRSPERTGRFLWPESRNVTDRHALLSKTEYRDISINEILYTTVGLVKDYAHTEIFELWFPDHRYTIVYDNYDQAFSALERGEVDLVMGSKAKLLAQTNFREQPGYKANIVFDYPYESVFGFNPDEALLCSIIEKSLQLTGTDSIADKWMNRTYDYRVKLAQAQFLWLVGGAALFLFTVILIFLSRAKIRADKESKQKSMFLTTMSHEIRTPMNAILGTAQIQMQKDGIPAEYAEGYKMIHKAGNRLLGTISDILNKSKIESEKTEAEETAERQISEKRALYETGIKPARVGRCLAATIFSQLIHRYKTRFEAYGGRAVREVYKGELNYECGKLFITVFIGLFVWLSYIRTDLQIHQFPVLVASIRIGLSLTCLCLILLRYTARLRFRPDIMIMVFVGYLCIGTSLLTGLSGEYAPSYIGGYVFIMMLPIFAPLTIKFKFILAILSSALFFLSAGLSGMDFSSSHISYSITDVFTALVVSLSVSYILDRVKYRNWEQRKKLENMVAQEQESKNIIVELARKADEANQSKSHFLATMSHEIRTPMNAIIGITQIQMQKENLPEEYATALEKIHLSGSSLLHIVNDILDMSKIETGKMELNPTEYDLPSLINDTVQLNIVRIGSKPINFILDIDKTLPSRMFGDELRLKQILNNLLSNAIKYTGKGHIKLTVSHSAQGESIGLRFAVEDTGQGMKSEDGDKLFSEFVRFNAEINRATEGTGLGLSIVKRLVEMMEGTINVESEYGKGSTFIVTVRQQAVECPAIGVELAEQLSTFTFSANRQFVDCQITREPMPYGKALVVDDVDTNLYVAKGLLLPYKLEVETADSGFAAIDKIKCGNTYDVIFMDHMMPGMDGIETTQKLRAMGYNGAVVALTANALVGNDEMFRQKGFDGFVSKPIDVRHLNDVLNQFIRDRHPEKAKKYKTEITAQTQPFGRDPKLIQIFCRDAEKAVAILRETITNGEIKLFTTTVHAMKSALANVGENEISKAAFALEEAGIKGDMTFISENTETFIESLETLVKSMTPFERKENANAETAEDIAYLIEQLRVIKLACDDYDDTAAYAALDALKEKAWKKETTDALERIRDILFLHSDFEETAEQAAALSENLPL